AGDALGLAHADREVADRVVLLPFALSVDFGTVLVTLLGEVEIVAGRIVGAVARERTVARPLHDLDVGIFLGHLVAHLIEVLDLDAEVIEAGLAAAAARDDGHADIAVADRDGRHFPRRVAGDLHPEHRTVEHAERRVVVGGDGQVVELAEHDRFLAAGLYAPIDGCTT